MGRELGRISGPLLAENLLRNGTDLAFESQLLYLNVNSKRIGINTSTPVRDLNIANTADTTNLLVDTLTEIGNFAISTNQFQHLTNTIIISPAQSSPVITAPGLTTSLLKFSSNTLLNSTANSNIEFSPIGTGVINLRNNTKVSGNLHATGTVTWDGNITIGDASTDSVIFSAKVNTNILPSITNTDNLGSTTNRWKNLYSPTLHNTSINTATLEVSTLLSLTGIINFNGNIILGTVNTNTVSIQKLSNNLVPATTNMYTVGTAAKVWLASYLTLLNVGNTTQIANNTLSTIAINTNLRLVSNGTGKIQIPSNAVQIDNSLTINNAITIAGITALQAVVVNGTVTQLGDIGQTGNTFITGLFSNYNIAIAGAGSYLQTPNFSITTNTITGRLTNSDVFYTANGSGAVNVQNLKFSSNNISNVVAGAITDTQKSVIIAPDGIGNTIVNTNTALVLPSGNNINRVNANNGEIRFNTTSGLVEANGITNTILTVISATVTNGGIGYSAGDILTVTTSTGIATFTVTAIDTGVVTAVSVLSGGSFTGTIAVTAQPTTVVPSTLRSGCTLTMQFTNTYVNLMQLYSNDRRTYITPELTAGTSDNILRFAVANTVTTTISSSKLFNNTMYAGNISISSNTISNLNTATDVLLSPSGTGLTKFNGTTYINGSEVFVPSTGAMTLASSNNGYIKFAGTNGLVIPSGTTATEPVSPQSGTIRYNTTISAGQVFNGTDWQPIGGSSAVLTTDEVTDAMYAWDLILG